MRRVLPALALLAAAPAVLFAQETSAGAAPNKVAAYNRVKIAERPSTGLYTGTLLKLQGHAIRKGQTEPDAGAPLFWSSDNLDVAWVAEDGTIVLLRPGQAKIAVSFGAVADTMTLEVKASPVVRVTLSGDKDVAGVGEAVRFSAKALAKGDQEVADAKVQYALEARGRSAGAASIDEHGVFTAKQPGIYTVIAVLGGVGDRKVVHVKGQDEGAIYAAGNVSKLEIEEPEYEAYVGTSAKLSAKIDGQKGGQAVWSSSDAKVAVVGADGLVSYVGVGKATITAERGGKKATRTIAVSHNPAAKMVLRTVGRDVFPNDTIALRAEVWARGSQVVRALRVNYALVSSAGGAAITEDGKFVASRPGVYTIVAETAGMSDMTTIIVRDPNAVDAVKR